MFQNNSISKYAVVYMAQPLYHNAPPFILACLGTDNKFTVKHVLQIWQYIYIICNFFNIVISIEAVDVTNDESISNFFHMC